MRQRSGPRATPSTIADILIRRYRWPTNLPSLAGFAVAVGLLAGLRSYPPAAARPAPCGI